MQPLQLTPWPDVEVVIRLVLAAAIGGAIGYEREMALKPAGFRTHILVCVGACLFTIASMSAFSDSRIAAGVVVGVGFLGAGNILREEHAVIGLTTAAAIWAVSGIGVAIGSGLYVVGIVTGLITFFVLRFPSPPMKPKSRDATRESSSRP